jgi:hypothetical protein
MGPSWGQLGSEADRLSWFVAVLGGARAGAFPFVFIIVMYYYFWGFIYLKF